MLPVPADPFNARTTLTLEDQTTLAYYRLEALASICPLGLDKLPFTIKIMLENALRNQTHGRSQRITCGCWPRGGRRGPRTRSSRSCRRACCCRTSPACPASSTWRRCATRWRGWAATRSASTRWCRPTWSSTTRSRSTTSARSDAFALERRAGVRAQPRALRAAALGAAGVRELPRRAARAPASSTRSTSSTWPASVQHARGRQRQTSLYPDTLVGTDSHTTMVNGLGVLGWGVGGIEAEAVLLGQPLYHADAARWSASASRRSCRRARPRPTWC